MPVHDLYQSMSVIDSISIPTALLAVLLSFGLQELNRVRQQRRERKQEIKKWLDEVVTLSRELQITAMSYGVYWEILEEEAPSPDSFEDFVEDAEFMDINEQLLEEFVENTDSFEDKKDFMGFFKEERKNFFPILGNSPEEFHSYYMELKSQWAQMPYEQESERLADVRDKMLEVTSFSLYISNEEGSDREDYRKMFELAGSLAAESGQAKNNF